MHLCKENNVDVILIEHIPMVQQLQEKLKHILIRVWSLNSFLPPSSQYVEYSQNWYKHQSKGKLTCDKSSIFKGLLKIFLANLKNMLLMGDAGKAVLVVKNQYRFSMQLL